MSSALTADIVAVLEQVDLKGIGDLDAPLTQLSHGEKNLIAIARVLLKKGRIMIEDEATAAVDTRHDQTIQVSVLGFVFVVVIFFALKESDDEASHYASGDCASHQHGRTV